MRLPSCKRNSGTAGYITLAELAVNTFVVASEKNRGQRSKNQGVEICSINCGLFQIVGQSEVLNPRHTNLVTTLIAAQRACLCLCWTAGKRPHTERHRTADPL